MSREEVFFKDMSYRLDIFISYRRPPRDVRLDHGPLCALLTLRVKLELERKPLIYVDDQIESGTSWPASVGAAIGGSRV